MTKSEYTTINPPSIPITYSILYIIYILISPSQINNLSIFTLFSFILFLSRFFVLLLRWKKNFIQLYTLGIFNKILEVQTSIRIFYNTRNVNIALILPINSIISLTLVISITITKTWFTSKLLSLYYCLELQLQIQQIHSHCYNELIKKLLEKMHSNYWFDSV